MQQVNLSKADSKILAQVFDPESGPAKAEVIVDPSLPADRHILDAQLLQDLKTREASAIRLIEDFERSSTQTPQAKDDTFKSALALLDDIVTECPEYASARNNRAQLRRWRFGDRSLLVRKRSSFNLNSLKSDGQKAVADLQRSITLASPARPQDAVSPARGRLLALAHTQLGAIYLAASRDMDQDADSGAEFESFQGWSKDSFEEEASRMFFLGGLYGNEVAKALAVHTNPHAKMCGNIVQEAMRKEMAQA